MDLSSGYPFWLAKNGLPHDYLKLEQSLSAEVVILGGGISGALAAYYLVEAGVDCILIDARSIGLGSTCASTSLLQYEIDTPLCELKQIRGLNHAVRAYQLCEEAIYKIGDISRKIGFPDFEYKSSLYYAAYKKDTAFLKKEFSIRKESGFKVEYLDAKAVQQEFLMNAPGAILSGVAGETNAYMLTHALLQHARAKGLRIYDRTLAQDIQHHKRSIRITTESGFTVKSKSLLYATGYEAVEQIDKKIVKLLSTFACASEQANKQQTHWKGNALMWNTADPYFYIRNTNDRRIIIGGRDVPFYNPAKRDQFLAGKTRQLVNDFKKIYPGIDFKPEFSWAGTFGSTTDGLPFIGNYKQLPNSLFALGFGGNGITFSLIAAEIITNLITGKKDKDAEIFSFDRL